MSQSKSGSNKLYVRDLQKWEMHADQMPSKDCRRWKRAERQRGKTEIRDQLSQQHGISEDDTNSGGLTNE